MLIQLIAQCTGIAKIGRRDRLRKAGSKTQGKEKDEQQTHNSIVNVWLMLTLWKPAKGTISATTCGGANGLRRDYDATCCTMI